MLYDQWREIAHAHGPELARTDLSNGRAWTFSQLIAVSDAGADPRENWLCPKGNGPEFVFEVLRGWRHNRVVCPLEETDVPPTCALPPGEIAHVKRTSATT